MSSILQISQVRPDDRLIIFQEQRVVISDNKFIWRFEELGVLSEPDNNLLVVESGNEGRLLAWHTDLEIASLLQAETRSLRSLLFLEDNSQFVQAGKAFQVLEWYLAHRYCGRCGAITEPGQESRVLVCSECKTQFFPRINPCAIVLVTRGEQVLLARHSRYASDFYSCLAGFIEVGETPEQTVQREVFEEVGLTVNNVRYHKSQAWPFPSQLMLGFYADYVSGDITPDGVEIDDARWFKPGELPKIPSSNISVAGELIRDFAPASG